MNESLLYITIAAVLSLLGFALVVFGFEWIYQIWLAELFEGWMLTFIAIPVVALISALLIYLFFYAIEDETGLHHH